MCENEVNSHPVECEKKLSLLCNQLWKCQQIPKKSSSEGKEYQKCGCLYKNCNLTVHTHLLPITLMHLFNHARLLPHEPHQCLKNI